MRLSSTLFLLAALGCDASTPGVRTNLPEGVQAISLLGDTLVAPVPSAEVVAAREAALAEAEAGYEANPQSADALIWVGRRQAYLGRYREAIATYTRGLELHPDDARLYRHRGHRYLTVRSLDAAVEDFLAATRLVAGQADEIEPDGQPNPAGIPTSTLQTNIWYHLGLAHYLRGDFERAASAYRECLRLSTTTDMQVATSHWLYMTLRRLGRAEEAAEVLAPIHADMEILENHDYFRLLRMYQGAAEPEALLEAAQAGEALANATVTYGVANWYLYSGGRDEAFDLFRRIVALPQWAAFGYLAAEAELAREGEGRIGG
jgi:tetratricopeptide (TPR) repeat protein